MSSSINQMVEDSHQEVIKTTQGIAQTADEIRVSVSEGREDLHYFTRQALPEMTNALRELRQLLVSLRNFSAALENKPNMLLFGKSKPQLGPGEE